MNQNRHTSPLQKLQNRSSFKPSFKNLINIQHQRAKSIQDLCPVKHLLSKKQTNRSLHQRKIKKNEKQNKIKNQLQNYCERSIPQKEFEKNPGQELKKCLQKLSQIEQAMRKYEQIFRNGKKGNGTKMHKNMREYSRLKRLQSQLEQHSNEIKIQAKAIIQLYDEKIRSINLMCNQFEIKENMYITTHNLNKELCKNDELEQRMNRLQFLLK